MRLTVARPHERHTPGYAPPKSKAHAVEVGQDGLTSRRTMCGLDVDGLRLVKAGFERQADWLDTPNGRCQRCQVAVERRLAVGAVGPGGERPPTAEAATRPGKPG